MESPPFSPTTPTAKSWWRLLGDDYEYESSDEYSESAILSPRTPASLGSFWNGLSGRNEENGEIVGETNNGELSSPGQQLPSQHVDSTSNKNKAQSPSDDKEIEPEIQNQGKRCFSLQGSADTLLDIVQDKVCKYDTLKSTSLRGVEDKVVKRVKETKHPAVWNLLGGNAPRQEVNQEGTLAQGFMGSFDFDPITTAPASGDEICAELNEDIKRIVELEEIAAKSRIKDTLEDSSKYKNLLRGSGSLLEEAKSGEEVLQDLALSSSILEDFDLTNTLDIVDENIDLEAELTDALKILQMSTLHPPPPPPPTPQAMPIDDVEINDEELDSFSVLTTEVPPIAGSHYDPFVNEGKTRSCFAPGAIFSPSNKPKKRSLFKLMHKSFSGTASTSNLTSDHALSTDSTIGASGSSSEEGNGRNSYVAYFRRGKAPHESIRLYEQASPKVFPTLESEVVVRVEASTISQSDCCIRQGTWWSKKREDALSLPIVPGVAFCGVVFQETKGARSGLKNGDKVISLTRVGANSRHLCINKDQIVKVPSSLDASRLACLPEIYLTVFQALHTKQRNASRYRSTSLKGESILILGGETLMGNACISLAVSAGASAIYATCPEDISENIELLGAIPVREDPKRWLSLIGGRLDRVIGVKNSTTTKSELTSSHVRVLNKNGMIIKVGPPGHLDVEGVVLNNLADEPEAKTNRTLYHYNVFDSWRYDPKQAKRDLSHLVKLLEDGSISPSIQETVPLDRVVHMHEKLETSGQDGFFLCKPWKKIDRTDTESIEIDQDRGFGSSSEESGPVEV